MKRIAVVTGASGGIGMATCVELGKAGYTIILCDRNEDKAKVTTQELTKQGIEADYYLMDVTDEQLVTKQIQAIGDTYGKIDVLVNAAGGLGGRSRFEEMTTEFYRSVLALNLDSVFYVTRAAIPFLKKSDYGSIINFTSIAGWNSGGPGAGIYGTSKAAVTTLTRAMAKDLGEYNIRVNAVSPGTIDTPFHSATKLNNPELFESWKNGITMKRFGEASEVATVVEFLASKKSSFLTGEVIQINGGQAFL